MYIHNIHIPGTPALTTLMQATRANRRSQACWHDLLWSVPIASIHGKRSSQSSKPMHPIAEGKGSRGNSVLKPSIIFSGLR